MILIIFFWTSLFILFHSYLGYALIAAAITGLRPKTLRNKINSTEYYPDVALVIPAYNELDYLEEKIQNSLALDYGHEKLNIVFVTDGSDDGSDKYISGHQNIRVLHDPERRGKATAINLAMEIINAEIVVFSDANTMLNRSAIREIVKHYRDEKVGGVAGEKKIGKAKLGKAVNAGEGFYWTYESWLKTVDSRFYSVVGAAGELFSIRKSLYQPIGEDIVLDDFVISLNLCLAGYVVRYEPDACATEAGSASIAEEEKRKVRISAGGFQAMSKLWPLFNVFKHPALSYLYISHRVFRWTICPFLLPALLIINFFLASGSLFFKITLAVQGTFYLLAIIGGLLSSRKVRVSIFFVPYYFIFMNWSLLQGLYRHLFTVQTVLWEKSRRSPLEITTKR